MTDPKRNPNIEAVEFRDDIERLTWGRVYAAVVSSARPDPARQADVAIHEMRKRSHGKYEDER